MIERHGNRVLLWSASSDAGVFLAIGNQTLASEEASYSIRPTWQVTLLMSNADELPAIVVSFPKEPFFHLYYVIDSAPTQQPIQIFLRRPGDAMQIRVEKCARNTRDR